MIDVKAKGCEALDQNVSIIESLYEDIVPDDGPTFPSESRHGGRSPHQCIEQNRLDHECGRIAHSPINSHTMCGILNLGTSAYAEEL